MIIYGTGRSVTFLYMTRSGVFCSTIKVELQSLKLGALESLPASNEAHLWRNVPCSSSHAIISGGGCPPTWLHSSAPVGPPAYRELTRTLHPNALAVALPLRHLLRLISTSAPRSSIASSSGASATGPASTLNT